MKVAHLFCESFVEMFSGNWVNPPRTYFLLSAKVEGSHLRFKKRTFDINCGFVDLVSDLNNVRVFK